MEQTIAVDPDSELGLRLKEAAAERKPLRVVSGETIYEVQVAAREMNPLELPHRDPAFIRRGLLRSAGALKGIDVEALKQELRDAREQDSHGRPA